MKYLTLVLLCLISSLTHADELPILNEVSQLQWKNRVIIVHQVNESDDWVLSQLTKVKSEIDDRDIIWFVISGTEQDAKLDTNYSDKIKNDFVDVTLKQYKIDQSEVLLIGKDGGVKSRESKLDFEKIFPRIDSMPMRQKEMRKREIDQS